MQFSLSYMRLHLIQFEQLRSLVFELLKPGPNSIGISCINCHTKQVLSEAVITASWSWCYSGLKWMQLKKLRFKNQSFNTPAQCFRQRWSKVVTRLLLHAHSMSVHFYQWGVSRCQLKDRHYHGLKERGLPNKGVDGTGGLVVIIP